MYVTYDPKAFHMWSMEDARRIKSVKMIELTKTHCTISAIAYSHKFRLYAIVTSEFKMLFINENGHLIESSRLDMSAIRLVNFLIFDERRE